jgi:prolyl-tRNA editing enzyme YbaK/EbsC (Cys-tRNA(Pro) deacylase)
MAGSRERVSDYLAKAGIKSEIREFAESTKNSSLAAEALGCTVAEIAKSVVFVGPHPAVVVLSGDKKVDSEKLGRLVGGPVRVATPEEVRSSTGYPVGGVPPFPHLNGVRVFADSSLARFGFVWAAAGAPNEVFRITAEDLVRLVGEGMHDLSV